MSETPPDRIDELDAMRMGVDYRSALKIRGLTLQIRPLAIVEFVQIANEVSNLLESLPDAERTTFREHLEVAKKTIQRATTPDVGSQVHPRLTDYILDRMTPEEVEFAYKQYVAATERANPALEEMKAEEIQELAARVKKSPSELIELSFLELVNLSRLLLLSHD